MSKPFGSSVVNPFAGYTAIAAVFALQHPKPWSERNPKANTSLSLRKEIRVFFEHISGGNVAELFNSVLIPEEREVVNPEAFSALRGLGRVYNSLPQSDSSRRVWLTALMDSGWSHKYVQDSLGWGHGRKTFGASVAAPMGRPATNQQYKSAVNDFLLTKSKDIVGRYVSDESSPTGKKPARHMFVTFRQAYMEFPHKDVVTYEAFLKMRPPEFKQSARPSDMCEYCEKRKMAGRTLATLRTENGLDAELSDADLMELYDGDTDNPIYTNAALCVEVDRHRFLSDLQRERYISVTASPPPGVLIIDMDWKKKITLPLAPVGMSTDAYHSCQVAVISFGFYTSAGFYTFDALSKTVTEDSHCSIQALKAALVKLRDDNVLDIRTFYSVQVWSDVGKHFRSKETAYFVLHDLQDFCATGCTITLNFLGEKHGKMRRDQHFRTLQPYYEQYSATHIIYSAGGLTKAIRYGHSQTKAFNALSGKSTPHLIVYEHTMPVTGTYTLRRYELDHMESHYCYGAVGKQLFVSPISGSDMRKVISPKVVTEKCTFEVKVSEPAPLPAAAQCVKTMSAKRKRRDDEFGPATGW